MASLRDRHSKLEVIPETPEHKYKKREESCSTIASACGSGKIAPKEESQDLGDPYILSIESQTWDIINQGAPESMCNEIY